MRISESCANCLFDRQKNKTDNEAYLGRIRELLDNRKETDTSPYMVYLFNELHERYFGAGADYKDIKKDDYMRIVLTDEDDVIGALADLRIIYPNIMRLEYDNTRTRAASIMPDASDTDSRTPLEVFASLYEAQNGRAMDEKQTMLITEMINKVWSEEK
jgi:hypothetical protein